MDVAERTLVLPLVAYRLEEAGVQAQWPARVVARAQAARRTEALLDAIRWREDARVLAALARAGIAPLLLKGAALARRLYPLPHLRPRVDTDLLVREEALERVGPVLAEAGYREDVMTRGRLVLAERRWVRTVLPGVEHVLDVHWRLVNVQEFAGVLPFAELEATAVEVGGFPVSARAPDDRYSLLAAAVHYVVHHGAAFDPLWLYDMHLLAARLGSAGVGDAAALARRHGIEALYRRALREVAHWFGPLEIPFSDASRQDAATGGGTVGVPLRRAGEAGSTSDERAVELYTRPSTRLIDVVIRDLAALPDWGARWRLVREHLLPPASYMLQRYGVRRRVYLPLLYLLRAVTGWPGWFRPFAVQRAAQARAAAGRLVPERHSRTDPDRTEEPMSPKASLDDVVRISKDVIYRELDGELVLLNLRTGVYFGLDRVGTRIWHLLVAHGSLRAVLDHLVAEYDAPSEQIERDLLDLVSRLAQKGLVTLRGASSGAVERRRARRRA